MRARIFVAFATVASLALFALVFGVIQPTASTAAPDAGVCVSIGVPITDTPTAEEAVKLKRIEDEIGKPLGRYTIGEEHCFATEAEAQEFVKTLDEPESSVAEPQGGFAPSSYIVAHLYEHADYNQYVSGRAAYYTASLPCSSQAALFYYVGDYMNDRTSSGFTQRNYGCDGGFRFYLDANLTTGPYLCSPECAYVGNTANDKISSMIVH
ncbi:MAG: hypothetical protein V9F06_14200 [Thermomicrobiales bacterium]